MNNNGLQIAYDFLCQAKQDLKTKNRFSVDSRLDALIDLLVAEPSNKETLTKDTILYRARIYKNDDAETRFHDPPIGTRYKGYNKSDSFVNINHESVSEGRCNPQYIPYLYASESELCCIHEIRPSKGSYVSVAKIKVSEDLCLVDLNAQAVRTSDYNNCIIENVPVAVMFLYLAVEFSRPHKNNGDYLLCQYVSERVKSYGFDGIKYKSAVYSGKGAINYVIFNFEKCKATSSLLRFISDVEIKTLSSKNRLRKLC